MDPSALIFVALAVAWAVYLIPKALEHHEESARTRSVDRFSHTMRVLARRVPVDERAAAKEKRKAEHAIAKREKAERKSAKRAERAAQREAAREAARQPARLAPAQARARRRAAALAAKRRRNVLSVIMFALVVVAAVAAAGVIEWVWTAIPGGIVIAWLALCRVMVRRERRVRRPSGRLPVPAPQPAAPVEPDIEQTGEIRVPSAETGSVAPDTDSWDPVPVTLPTYVSKPVASRSVREIDLDSTGVWSSGRSEADSALAREAEESERAARVEGERAVGT